MGEIVLKGQNRRVFEDKLKTVTRRRMAKFGTFKVSIVQSTLYVEPQTDDCDLDGAWEACGTIFGVAQMCRCRACEKDLDAIFAAVCDYLGDELSMARSFKVESKRSDKRFPLNSIQISQEIGGRLAEEFPNVAVDVHTPDYTVNIEVRETAAYVHGPSVPGAGGLPTGTGGRAAVLLSGGIDSPVAGYMIAKRGVEIECIHFFSYPYTSELAKEKVLELAHIMTKFCGRMTVDIVGFTEIQEAIRDHCREEYFTIIMRRFMMRIAEAHRPRTTARSASSRAKTSARSRQPDHGRHGRDRRGRPYADLPSAHRHGQGGDRHRRPPHRHAGDLHPARMRTAAPSLRPSTRRQSRSSRRSRPRSRSWTSRASSPAPSPTPKRRRSGTMKMNSSAERALSHLREQGLTLATAESCTGGLIGKLLTDVPGASQVYKGGVISYTNEVKHALLGVEQETLDVCTAVSRETAHEMARGARESCGADCGVSVTGLAGPDGDGTGRPVGLVYIAIDTAGFSFCRELHLTGDRAAIRTQAAEAVFQLLLDLI